MAFAQSGRLIGHRLLIADCGDIWRAGLCELYPPPLAGGNLMIRRLFRAGSPFRPSPIALIVSYIILGLWSLFVLFAIYWVIITAFKGPGDVNNGPRYIPF